MGLGGTPRRMAKVTNNHYLCVCSVPQAGSVHVPRQPPALPSRFNHVDQGPTLG